MSWLRNASSGLRIGENSKPAPTVDGIHFSITTPLGTYTTPKRFSGCAAVLTIGVKAGTMLSRSGNATAAPRPRSTVRRGIVFFETIMSRTSAFETACS
jgi:hypothetical protein